ncbi:MAG: hypothetical protein M3065_20595 [Actinomycetota bacterium]|nr:hypothetical protein [Actinomycetota bacterium]
MSTSLADPTGIRPGSSAGGHGATARASVILPVAANIAARNLVPVQLRGDDGDLMGFMPADGRYHTVPTGPLTFFAALPDGHAFQASTEVAPGTSVRIKLQGDVRPGRRTPVATPLERQRTTLRFLLQSSIDSYEQSREPSLTSTVLAAADEVRLRLTSPAVGVQFLQLLTPKHFPINVAYAGDAQVKLVNIGERLTADVSVLDKGLALALAYAESGRTREALMTLELQGRGAEDAKQMPAVTDAVVLLEILFLASHSDEIEDAAATLAEAHPDVADFHVMAAECATQRDDDRTALAHLAQLKTAGLPLLYGSFVRAVTRLSAYAAAEFRCGDGPPVAKAPALEAILTRLRELGPHVDAASSLLVIRGPGPDLPASKLDLRAKAALAAARRLSRTYFEIRPPSKEQAMTTQMTAALAPKGTAAGTTNGTTSKPQPTKLALIAAAVALLIWVGFAIYLLIQSGAKDVKWTRLAWVFSSVEAVAFAAAGLLFGTTVNRQRAERAEADADSTRTEAENGRVLATALKAEEPAVVHEGGDDSEAPRALGGDDRAADIAARHARLARELFP